MSSPIHLREQRHWFGRDLVGSITKLEPALTRSPSPAAKIPSGSSISKSMEPPVAPKIGWIFLHESLRLEIVPLLPAAAAVRMWAAEPCRAERYQRNPNPRGAAPIVSAVSP